MTKNIYKIIVQARTGSTRFHKKIVRTVDDNKTFLHILLSRLSEIKNYAEVIVATTNNKNDDVIETISASMDTKVFRGSEENVLKRFIECAQEFNATHIIRVCSDNPFLDIKSTVKLIQMYKNEDYLSYSVKKTPSILTHYGFFPELVTLEALRKAQKISGNCSEHVTNCIYLNPDKFNVNFIPVNISSDKIRCTLDTESDFEILKHIYIEWYKKTTPNNRDYSNLVRFITNEPDLLNKMDEQINKNKK